ncbi:MAG: hypothetical protein ACR2K0_05450 [Acidimicrobiales bacterium]
MPVLIALVALALVFVVAAVVIGRESGRLSGEAPRPVFDYDEAVAWVAERLPFEVSAVLSHDDVRRMLRWGLDDLASGEVSASDVGGRSPGPPDGLTVVGDAEAVASVVARARAAGADYTPSQVEAVLDAQLAYLLAIGAMGPAEPGEPPPG